jgi:hypothetical protein
VMGDGFGIISTEYESRLDIAAQQELRPPMPNPTDETGTDAKKEDPFHYLRNSLVEVVTRERLSASVLGLLVFRFLW